MKLKLGVFISGSGSNLQNIIDSINNNEIDAEIQFVFSNNPNAYGLERAKNANLKTFCLPKIKFSKDLDSKERIDYEKEIINMIKDFEIDYLCLAGFMHILRQDFINYFHGKTINIHPALLPSFKGLNGQKQAFEAGVKIAGCTVHYVLPEIDSGEIISQGAITLEECDNTDALSSKILNAEHLTYTYSLKKLCGRDDKDLHNYRNIAYDKGILLY